MSNVHAQGLAYTVYVYIHEVQIKKISRESFNYIVEKVRYIWYIKDILMKNPLYLILFSAFAVCAKAQSLSVVEQDTVVEVNSTAMADYSFYIKIKNTSSVDLDVRVRRAYHNNLSCAYDSTAFCWDFCYGPEVDNSIGALNISAGDEKNDFSGHIFSPTTGATCIDSTRYVFYNSEDSSDSLSVWVHISAGPTIGTVDVQIAADKLYPNPARNYITMETSKSGQFTLYNTLGALVKTKALNPGKNAISVAELSNGVYLYSVDGSSFKKLIIRH